MTLPEFITTGQIAIFGTGIFFGAVIGWMILRFRYGIRLARLSLERDSQVSYLNRTVQEKTDERDVCRADLVRQQEALKSAEERILALSEERSAALSKLDHLASVENSLAAARTHAADLQKEITELKQQAAHFETVIEKERSSAAEKIALLEDVRNNLADTYKAISANALEQNNRSFMDLAKATFTKYLESAKTEFELRSTAVKDVVAPVKEALHKYDEFVRAVERQRESAYGGIKEQMYSLVKSQNDLQKETGRLVKALRVPHVRGRWGEITLKRVAELAGMRDRCDFVEQPVSSGEEGAVRPDMVIALPGSRQVVVDAKVPLSAYLDALEAETDEKHDECLAAHARHVQNHILQLSQKGYWAQFQPTPEFVILFIPGENFFSAALSKNPGLIEFGVEKGVIPATPTTLITLLKTVYFAWRQETVAENAKSISELGKDLYERLNVMAKHIQRLGRDIDRCTTTYNQVVGSFERRVLTAARKFNELGLNLKGDDELLSLDPVETKARILHDDDENP